MAKIKSTKGGVGEGADAAASEKDKVQPVLTTERLFNAIINELVRSRIRFRSLLQVLTSEGLVHMKSYVAEYEKQEQESFAALADSLLLDPIEFFQRHSEWMNSERGGKFAQITSNYARPSVTLTPNSLDDSDADG